MLHLITTADERVYNYKKPVLFLGEWCKPYRNKSIWLINDSITVEPFGVGLETKQANISYIQETHNAFLSILSTRLNKLNNTVYSERYYNIILGHWLYRFLSVVFNRYSTILDPIKPAPPVTSIFIRINITGCRPRAGASTPWS